MVTEEKLVYEVEELIPILHLSRPSVYKAVKDGTIPSIKIGRRRLIPVSAFKIYLANAGGPVSK